jgi:hypothetical protein
MDALRASAKCDCGAAAVTPSFFLSCEFTFRVSRRFQGFLGPAHFAFGTKFLEW